MTDLRPDNRHRLVTATAGLFLRRGYHGTGLKEITETSRAPVGSLYHHFPGGKEELAAEALRVAADGYEGVVAAVIDSAPDVASGIRVSFAAAAEVLRLSDYADACPIATVALEVASTNERLRLVTGAIFEGWTEMLAMRLRSAGLDAVPAREIALTYLAALEGGFLLCRAAKSTEAMDAVGRFVADRVDAALAEADSR